MEESDAIKMVSANTNLSEYFRLSRNKRPDNLLPPKILLTAFKYGPIWYPNRNLRPDISDTLICSTNSTVFNFYNNILLISVSICFILNSLFVLILSQFYDRISSDLLWWSFVVCCALEWCAIYSFSCHIFLQSTHLQRLFWYHLCHILY